MTKRTNVHSDFIEELRKKREDFISIFSLKPEDAKFATAISKLKKKNWKNTNLNDKG